MTIEEKVEGLTENLKSLTEKVDTLTANLVKRDETIDQLLANQKQQNSYITKLEAQAKAGNTKKPVSNKAYEEFMMNKFKNEVIDAGLDQAGSTYDKSHVDAMEEEVRKYCLDNMTDTNITDGYVLSVFQLLYGRALGNPEHVIHKLRVNPNVVQPRQPAPQPQPLHQTLTPPIVRQEGILPGNVPPVRQKKTIKETFGSLGERLNAAMQTDQ